ncbi:MAG TPA: hypothetical protein VF188_08105 [Longimicrobiales bacterium]
MMMINGAAFPDKEEVEARMRLLSHGGRPLGASGVSSGGASQSSVTLEPGVPFDLGCFNGKAVQIRLLPDGGYEWNGQPRRTPPEPGWVTVDDVLAARAAVVFSREEYQAITPVLGVIRGLYLVTRGIWSLELLNAYLAEFASPSSARDAVRRLGLDPDQPFTVNGYPLRLLGDRFTRWVPEE